MAVIDRAILLGGYMLLPYSVAVALGSMIAVALDNPVPLVIGVALGLGWAIVGIAAWAAEVSP